MSLKNALISFSEMNIGPYICTLYDVTTQDLELISLIMAEEQALKQEEEKRKQGKPPDGGS